MALSSPPADQLGTRADGDAPPPPIPGHGYVANWKAPTGVFAVLVALGAVMLSWAAVCAAAGGAAAPVATDVSDLLLRFARTLAELGGAFAFVGLLREWLLPRLVTAR